MTIFLRCHFERPARNLSWTLQTDGFKLNHYQIFKPIDICLYTKYLDIKVIDEHR
jgi:hypothetical protein